MKPLPLEMPAGPTIEPALVAGVLEQAIAIQQIPAPTFDEARRGEFVRDQFLSAGLIAVERDELGNVYACRPGGGGPALLVSAHLDTVFPAGTDLAIRRENGRIVGPGIGDNSLGVAGLFGLAWALEAAHVELPGDIWLAANVGEEGLGDLRGMRSVLDRLGEKIAAAIVLEGMALGRVYHRGIGVRRYRITTRAEGGHSWLHFGRPSAIHTLVRLGARLTDLILPESPRTTFNLGVISGGTSVNTIAREASLLLDLRSEAPEVLRALARRVEEIVASFHQPGAPVTAEVIGDRPVGAIAGDHPLVRLAVGALEAAGVREYSLEAGSTDANEPLSRGLPAVCIGLTKGGHAHRPDEFIETEPLAGGLRQLLALVVGAAHHFCASDS